MVVGVGWPCHDEPVRRLGARAIVVGLVIHTATSAPLLPTMLALLLTQTLSCYVLGLPLYHWLNKRFPDFHEDML